MSDKLNIFTLDAPHIWEFGHGAYFLLGLYMSLYWQFMEALEENTLSTEERDVYEAWFKQVVEQLPQWAIDILAEIDNALDIADGQGMDS